MSASARPPSARRLRTRERLIDAAAMVFARRGIGRASIEEICEAAGFTRGAFYSNFADLDELFLALYTQRASRAAEQIAGALREQRESTIPALVDRVLDALTVDRDWLLVRTEYFLHAARDPVAAAVLAAHREAMVETLAPALAEVVDREALPAELRSPRELARAVVAVHDGTTTELLLDDDPGAHRAWLRELLLLLLDR
ncbi:TetR family transcriptional regulator [Nakamurella sp. YIM 132087]|uniref:TetR family transcriptional regulator n=1 Tax=Nakamurella alba TaxID=2665158 RepID=A0A7K1FMC6_9ACTN|nr:TetR/AcrR family transcriptional regulator [Nakamurella alba]MTD15220.1 TetR family transcriptional regulator [Nakamurella alba]